MTPEPRFLLDCRKHDHATGCSLFLSGRVREVLDAGLYHWVTMHGLPNTPESRETVRRMMEDAPEP